MCLVCPAEKRRRKTPLENLRFDYSFAETAHIDKNDSVWSHRKENDFEEWWLKELKKGQVWINADNNKTDPKTGEELKTIKLGEKRINIPISMYKKRMKGLIHSKRERAKTLSDAI
jgi:hypothetical protein